MSTEKEEKEKRYDLMMLRSDVVDMLAVKRFVLKVIIGRI